MAYRFRRRETVNAGVQRLARAQLERALAQLEVADEAAIHEARKSLKRLRGLLRLVRCDLHGHYAQANARLRDAGRALAGVRDAQVRLATFDRLKLPEAQALRALLAAHSAQREKRLADDVARAKALLAEVQAQLADWPPVGEGALWCGLKCSYRRGRRALAQAEASGEAEALHTLRKRVKDLWYQLTLLAPCYPELLEASAASCHRLSDDLGDHHDLAVLAQWLAVQPPSAAREAACAAIAVASGELKARALALARRLYVERAGAFVARHAAYWRLWRAE